VAILRGQKSRLDATQMRVAPLLPEIELRSNSLFEQPTDLVATQVKRLDCFDVSTMRHGCSV
jgi:hypothetical protein